MFVNRIRYFIEAGVVLLVLLLQGQLSRWVLDLASFRGSRPRRFAIWAANALIALWLGVTLVSTTGRAMLWFPRWPWLQWNIGLAIGWTMFICGVFPLILLLRRLPPFDPARRRLLHAAHAAAVAAPLGVIGFGILVNRKSFELREVDIEIPGLAKDLNGLRLAQLTDIHFGPFLRGADLARIVSSTPARTEPALLIAHRLYGDASRADEIIARNKIAHPLFVPGGTPLEVLSD